MHPRAERHLRPQKAGTLLPRPSREVWPCDTSGLWPPELCDWMFLLFWATQAADVCEAVTGDEARTVPAALPHPGASSAAERVRPRPAPSVPGQGSRPSREHRPPPAVLCASVQEGASAGHGSASCAPSQTGGNSTLHPTSLNSAGAAAGNQAMKPSLFRFGARLISHDLWEMS